MRVKSTISIMSHESDRREPICLVYKTVDKQDIDVDVYLPPSTVPPSTKGFPVLINIHGGAFILGSSAMVNQDQVQDCLNRSWVVLAPNHRLCPQVNILEGPIQDCRDLLSWIYRGDLQVQISRQLNGTFLIDQGKVFAFGTSSGGTLACCLGFGVPRPVAGIFNMYGPCNFSDPYWTAKLPHIAALIPDTVTEEFISQIFDTPTAPITGGASLEGQTGAPNLSDPRVAFTFTQIANGTLLDCIFPSKKWEEIDPVKNIGDSFPPTYIAHGTNDVVVPIDLSRALYQKLTSKGVKCGMAEVPDEGHTFGGTMKVGSRTWELHRQGFDFLEGLI